MTTSFFERSIFHEFPHPENWREAVDELYSRFGSEGEGIPLSMCPCGNRKATARRFLVARKYKVDEAEKMLRDTLHWRQTVSVGDVVGVDSILKAKPRWDLLSDSRKIIPSTPFHCYSKQGFPVYVLRLGKGDGSLAASTAEECHVYSSIIRGEHLTRSIIPDAHKRGLLQNLTKGSSAGVTTPKLERLSHEDLDSETTIDITDNMEILDKQVVLVDLDGVGMSALRCLYVFKTINSVAAYNYPELSKAIYVLNTPSVFDYIWAAIKPILSPHTQSKIKIFQAGSDQYSALQQIIEDDDIPDFLTPQVPGDPLRGKAGCVTGSELPSFRPSGVVSLDTWIESQSDDPDKSCPF